MLFVTITNIIDLQNEIKAEFAGYDFGFLIIAAEGKGSPLETIK